MAARSLQSDAGNGFRDVIVTPDVGALALNPVGIGTADEDRGIVKGRAPLELQAEHVGMAGSDGLNTAEVGDCGDDVLVDVGRDFEE